MTPDALRARIDGVATWRRGGQRAPHKPLLLLLALARFAGGEERLPFSAVEAPLRGLLRDFGPARAGYHPEYPFWRLQNDGLWQLGGTAGLVRRASNADPTLASLRAADPVGRFPDDMAALLRARPECIAELAEAVLAAHFPDTLHGEILAAVGLDLEALPGDVGAPRRRRRRDPAFRDAVLRAYGYRCAVCGFETRVGHTLVGLDAAHVRWHQAGGAGVDDVSNGVALCVLHHRLLDRGAFTLRPTSARERLVEVSEDAHGGGGFETWLLAFHGRPLAEPTRPAYRVAEPSAAWHRSEVFRGAPRGPVAAGRR